MARPRIVFALGIAALTAASGALAQTPAGALSIEQVERRYNHMSPVHIRKCDYNGDGLIESREIPCVEGIYRSLYDDRS
jgi:hypothetical protein